MNELLVKLKRDVPEFEEFEEFDNILYVDFDRLGRYINLLSLKKSKNSIEENNEILIKIFKYLDSIFNPKDDRILNLLITTIFESLLETKFGYTIASKYMGEEILSSFLEKFPIRKHANDWNKKEFYSNEDLDKLINSLDDID